MSLVNTILISGAVYSLILGLFLALVFARSPRLMLHAYPHAIQLQVPEKTDKEKRETFIFGFPFIMMMTLFPLLTGLWLRISYHFSVIECFLYGAGIVFIFNLFDLLVIDWLIFCTLTPSFIVVKGSHKADYADFSFHFSAFLRGLIFTLIAAALTASAAALL